MKNMILVSAMLYKTAELGANSKRKRLHALYRLLIPK
jgi:hypothetical protein